MKEPGKQNSGMKVEVAKLAAAIEKLKQH